MDQTNNTEDAIAKKKKVFSWNIIQDIELTKAFIKVNVDGDADVSNQSSSKTLWERVLYVFNQNDNCRVSERTPRSLETRWQKIILPEVNKFMSYLAEVEESNGTAPEADKIEKARRLYLEKNKKIFVYEDCWKLLKQRPEWLSKNKQQRDKDFLSLKRRFDEADDEWIRCKTNFIKLEDRKAALMERSNELTEATIELQIMSKDLSEEADPRVIEFFNLKRSEILERAKAKKKDEVRVETVEIHEIE